MAEQPNPEESGISGLQGSVHLSLSNLISYTVVSGAAMLAFFFAFQATLLAYYPSIRTGLIDKSIIIQSTSIPIGRISITMICILVVAFNYWSYKIIRVFSYYMELYLISGTDLERSTALSRGIYLPLYEGYKKYGRHGHGIYVTRSVLLILSLAWVALGMVGWSTD